MSKKVDWNNKDLVVATVSRSKTWKQAIERLGLKYVSSNIKTLKKYAEKYGAKLGALKESSVERLDRDIEGEQLEQLWGEPLPVELVKEDQELGTKGHVKIVGAAKTKDEHVEITLEWDDEFVAFLREHGYTGGSEEEIVYKWFRDLEAQVRVMLMEED